MSTQPSKQSGAISPELQAEINLHRAKLAPYFNGQAKPNPSISFANEGTGFGKSYNVFDQFVEHAASQKGKGHRNLFFITPHKAQIDIAATTQAKAAQLGISILSFLSETDLTDLEFIGWVTRLSNQTLYQGWIKTLGSSDYYQPTTSELDYAMMGLMYMRRELEQFLLHGFSTYQTQGELDKRIRAAETRLLQALYALAKAVLNEQVNQAYPDIEELLQPSQNLGEQVKTQIIDHLLPFERAKLGPTILLATTARFLRRAYLSYVDKSTKPNIKKLWLDDILGAKREPTAAEIRDTPSIGSVCALNHAGHIEYLKNSFFLVDDHNPFRAKDIRFDLVIDEEHDSYNRMFDDCLKKMLNKDVKPPHVIAGLHRLLEMLAVEYEQGERKAIAYEETSTLINDLRQHYEHDCAASVSLDVIMQMCAGNVGHITIDNRDVEQIVALSQNVFSLSPKRFYNENALRKIRMRSMFGNSEIRLSLDDGSPSADPSLYDFLQLMLCALYACSKIPDNSPLRDVLRMGNNASQNAPLADFITSARQHRAYVAALFARAKEEDVFIDSFFVYFVPKIVFSLVKVEEIPFDSTVADHRVFVDLHLDLIRELPETRLLSILHNTRNSAMCLSATTGFVQSYSGNFSRPMLSHYGEHPESSLEVALLQRSAADQDAMADLRRARAKARTSQILPFHDSAGDRISGLHQHADFQRAYRWWWNALAGQINDNKYRMSAFRRQIETLLMAAWEGKNTLALSLNGRFADLFKGFFMQDGARNLKGFTALHKEWVFELEPILGKGKVRVILFCAELAKEVDIDHYLRVEEGTSICLFAAYQSAGTGLNLFVERAKDGLQQDFDRLVLINSPFYSDILQKDSGFNSVRNHILLLRHLAAKPGHMLPLSQFDSNLMKPQNSRILRREHNLALLKTIIQAVGRVERRDSFLHSEIFLPDDLLDHLMLMYSQLQSQGNSSLINSLSLLNHRLMLFCLARAKQRSFANEEECQAFADQVAAAAGEIGNFFSGAFRNEILRSARAGNADAIRFNELLRSASSISAPQDYVQRLLKSPLVKASAYYQHIIQQFYLPRAITDRVTLCTTAEEPLRLSDLRHGQALYQPAVWIIPEYAKADSNDNSGIRIINSVGDQAEQGISRHLPNPALLDVLKGNVGELIFANLLSALDIQPLDWQQLVELLSADAYERYDFYIQQGERLLCIDVKHWSASLADEELADKMLKRAEIQRQRLLELCAPRGLQPSFIYVNTRHSHNALNVEAEAQEGTAIHFLNAFKKLNHYQPHATRNNTFVASDSLAINPRLTQLLRSEE